MIGARNHGICLLGPDGNMKYLLEEIRHSPLLWLLVLVPVVLSIYALNPEAHTLLFLLSVAAIVPWLLCSVAQPNRWPPKPAI